MFKRKSALLSMTLILSLVVGGCASGNNSDAGKEPASSAEATGKQVNLTFAVETPKDEETKQVWQEIIDGYTSKHENAKIKLDYAPSDGDSFRTWLTTGLIGGTSPDIIPSRYTWTHEDLNKDLLTDLTPEYDKPNPYAGDRIWKDTFTQSILNEMKNPLSEKIAGITLQTLSIRVFYNQDLFEKNNLQIPKTWTEFIDVQSKLKAAGVTPFAFANSKPGDNHLLWAVNMMTNQIAAEKVRSYDFDQNTQLSLNEIAASVDEGAVNLESSDWTGFMPIIKDWSQYWAKGYNAMNGDAAKEMFLRGDAAMVLAGNFELKTIQDSKARKFEFGTFALPYLTKNENPNAAEKNYELGGYPDLVFAIPKKVTGDKLDVAVDFLKYLSSPEVATLMGNKMYVTTTLANVDLPVNLSGFQFVGQRILVNFYAAHIDKKLNEDLVKIGQLYLEGTVSEEKYKSELQKTLKNDMTAVLKTNNWTKENKYGTKE
ncbi:ABC transporter substrate-binding protein [Paenibacillus eucommiae]|uniref:ABC-type glycerol-3-phosphate transport system substrate-binding protein n=1 Tax=Paenibacillus eucommiae TaxID=1355755 RepID=A0ABS4IYC2_9BACL|nr:extracellular solute-binding protein [Paenibacillus eucommiae]MBP1991981.1 ABC-type glycerol-3-phosphate transport system substrate-binding protein [Paenibacillus eucommiae]